MFPPPPLVETEIFARLPEEHDRSDRFSEWLHLQQRGRRLGSFLEGPSFDRDGNLWCVDLAHGRIFRISPEAEWTLVADYDGEPNGLKIHEDGRIFIADHKHGIMRLDPATGEVTPHFDRPLLERFKGVNDLFFAANGDLWFTDQGQTGLQDPTGRLHRLTPEGRLDTLLANVPSPNGLVMNLEESLIHLAVTRDNAVWRVPLLLTGGTSKVGRYLQLSGGAGGPDGMALDEAGNLAVCHAGLGVVWLFSELGEPILRIQSRTGRLTTNCAYGGEDNRTLFITESDTSLILKVRLDVPGKRMFSGA